jgi:hypothetical protein
MALNPSGTTTTYSPGTTGTAEAVVADDRRTMLLNRAAWGAVFAGVATALVIQLLLNILGLGVGASSLDASNAADNPSASGFSLTAGIWWTISGIIASFVGGAIAGRLCGSSNVNTARWHGFVSWAATTLVVFYLLTSAVGGILGGTFNALGSTLGGVGKTAASAVSGVAQGADQNAIESRVRELVNPNDAQSVQDSVVSYIRASINGDQQAAQAAKDRAVNGVAKLANISPDEARGRVDQMTQQMQQTAQQAKDQAARAAEATRKGVASAGIFGFIALVLGAAAAWIGGGVGTPKRETAVLPADAGRLT